MNNVDNVGGLRCPKCHGTLEVLVNQAEPWAASSFAPCPDCHPSAKKEVPGELPPLPESLNSVYIIPREGGVSVENPFSDYYSVDQMRAYGELCRAAPAGGDSWPLEVGDALLKWNRSHPAGPLISIGYEYGVAAKVAEIMRDSAPAGSGEVEEMAQRLEERAKWFRDGNDDATLLRTAAALLRKLQQPAEEDAYVIEQMGRLLAEIAIIVNGPEPALTKWSYHDLPEKVRKLQQGAGEGREGGSDA